MCYNNCLMKIFTKWIFFSENVLWKWVHGICKYFYCLSCEIPCFVYHGTFWCVNRKRGSVFKIMVFRWLYLNIPRYRRSSCWSSRFFVTYHCFGPQLFAAVLILSARPCRKSTATRWRCMALLLAVI